MSAQYRPDESALPLPPWTTIHLANRDLAEVVPINFVTHAGVSLTSACFAYDVFEDSEAEKCISNLLAAHFKRFIVDLYWDTSVRQFSFCPVSISPLLQEPNLSSAPVTSRVQTSQSISEVSLISTTRPIFTTSSNVENGVRQAASSTPGTAFNATSSTSQSSTRVPNPPSTDTTSNGATLYDIGPYQCSSTLNLPFLASLVEDYIRNTSDTLSANILYFQFNLHAAAPNDAPTDPAPSPSGSDLPSETELVGRIFNAATPLLIYQPSELLRERENVNDSWFTVPAAEQPVSEYFIMNDSLGDHQRTPDGWPSEFFAEIRRFNRILISWGSIDSQMEDYDFAGDSDVVFPQNYTSSLRDVRVNSDGQIESGCFFYAEQPIVAQSNSSWALSVLHATSPSLDSPDRLWSLARNLTSCGITPTLNMTLVNQTANLNALPYVQFVQSTVWNWAPGEPRNVTIPDTNSGNDENLEGQFRCALMDISTSSNAGRWRVEDCSISHRAACRIGNQPYLWQLSGDSVPFTTAELACQANSSFSAPRTGLENTYLYQHILNLPDSSRSGMSGGGSGVWLNFNSIDVEACWVTTGPNGTCSYFVDEEALRQRTVLVPVIAALVVLLLTALTLFVKCNKNRRNSRKRTRGGGGWDYEGVPS